MRWTDGDLAALHARQRALGDGGATAPQAKPAATRQRAPRVAERDVQAAVLALLEAHPAVAWAARINTGAGFLVPAGIWRRLLAGERAQAIWARFVRFAFPGCPDVLGMLKGGRLLACECKARDGKVSDDQARFLALVARWGGLALVARDAGEVAAAIDAAAAHGAGEPSAGAPAGIGAP